MATTLNGNYIELFKNEDYKPILVIGCTHGDEPQGKYLINEYLTSHKNSKLLFIPCLNPDGVELNSRTNINGVDINRNFPTQNWELTEKNNFFGGVKPASEIETKFLMEIVEKYEPKLILSLHAPYKVVNYDGEGELVKDVAKKISKIIGYPTEEDIGYPTPGSFGTWAGIEKGIPTITLELDEEIDVEELKKPIFEIFETLEDYDILQYAE